MSGASATSPINYALALDATVTDPAGMVRHLVFDYGGYTTSETYGYGQPDAQTYTYRRDVNSEYRTQVTDPLGRVTQYSLDGEGHVTSATVAAGTASAATYSFSYTPDYGDLASVTDPLGHTTSYSYTGGCLTQVSNALGQTLNLTCNGAGQPTSVTDVLGRTVQFSYSGYDLSSVTDPLSHTTIFYRDVLGRLTGALDPLGNIASRTYDSNDQVISATDPLGQITQFGYDANGNLTSVTDPASGVISFAYDSRNRRSAEIDSLLHAQSWTYDGLSRPLTYTDRNSQQTSIAYDDLGRLASITDASGSLIQYAYDAGDRPTSISDSASGTIGLGYDLLDRLTQQQTPQGQIAYGYDAAGRRTSMQVAGQPQVSYSYDAINRLLQLGNGSETVGYGYDAVNRRTSLTLPNGIQTVYAYDNADQLTGLSYLSSGGAVLGSLAYGYDNAGRRLSQSGSWSSDQLPAATVSDYQYNAENRLVGGNGYAPVYDNEGQMTQDGQGRTYVWNARHQLQQILQGAVTVASFQYDVFGRRTQKTVNGNATGYLYDGDDPAQEQQGTVLGNILMGPGIDERYARDDSIGRTYFLTDALGSTVALADVNGNVQQQYAYEPYGGYTASGQSGLTNPYTYTGREDDGTGLYYYRARYYSPQMARFISEDPLGLGGGSNVYAYVNGNPISETDPSGNCPWCIGAVIGAGTDLALQLLANGGNIHCVNWLQVGISGAVGAVGGANFSGMFKFAASARSEFEVSWEWANAGRRIRNAQDIDRGFDLHHWLIPRGGWGRYVPNPIKNHPWNLNPIERGVHQALHNDIDNGLEQTLAGSPDWARWAAGSVGAGAAGQTAQGGGCDCN